MTANPRCCVVGCSLPAGTKGVSVNEIGQRNAPAIWECTTWHGSKFYCCDPCKRQYEDPKHGIGFKRISGEEPEIDISDIW